MLVKPTPTPPSARSVWVTAAESDVLSVATSAPAFSASTTSPTSVWGLIGSLKYWFSSLATSPSNSNAKEILPQDGSFAIPIPSNIIASPTPSPTSSPTPISPSSAPVPTLPVPTLTSAPTTISIPALALIPIPTLSPLPSHTLLPPNKCVRVSFSTHDSEDGRGLGISGVSTYMRAEREAPPLTPHEPALIVFRPSHHDISIPDPRLHTSCVANSLSPSPLVLSPLFLKEDTGDLEDRDSKDAVDLMTPLAPTAVQDAIAPALSQQRATSAKANQTAPSHTPSLNILRTRIPLEDVDSDDEDGNPILHGRRFPTVKSRTSAPAIRPATSFDEDNNCSVSDDGSALDLSALGGIKSGNKITKVPSNLPPTHAAAHSPPLKDTYCSLPLRVQLGVRREPTRWSMGIDLGVEGIWGEGNELQRPSSVLCEPRSWVCGDCHTINHTTRMRCRRCSMHQYTPLARGAVVAEEERVRALDRTPPWPSVTLARNLVSRGQPIHYMPLRDFPSSIHYTSSHTSTSSGILHTPHYLRTPPTSPYDTSPYPCNHAAYSSEAHVLDVLARQGVCDDDTLKRLRAITAADPNPNHTITTRPSF
ncbi:hypothetical protein EON64_06290, partial [archaeon]